MTSRMTVNFRVACLDDIKQIQEVEREYYEGFNCSEDILKNWIQNLPDNFIVAEKDDRLVGFIFFEYLNEIRAIPFVHKLEHKIGGKYAYVSEIGILDGLQNSEILQELFDEMIEKCEKDGCEAVVWMTGKKSKHDKIESRLLLDNGFVKGENVKQWEAYPNHFVDDHYIWVKTLT
jgi:N-acetylglutamate synthase-like GNAT family acetyltransferase